MISKIKIKRLRSLRLKKNREKYNNAVVEGYKIINELSRHNPDKILHIWHIKDFNDLGDLRLRLPRVAVDEISIQEMKQISVFLNIPEVVALVEIPEKKPLASDQNLILYLHDIQDPGNLGTIIRSAEWFGHRHLVCSSKCADHFSAKVIQASMGSVFRLNIIVLPIDEVMAQLPDHTLVCADMHGEAIEDWSTADADAVVVIGNEGQGVPLYIREKADRCVSITGSKQVIPDSLNAAIATGICLFKWGPLEMKKK